jgi:hypothetical protein
MRSDGVTIEALCSDICGLVQVSQGSVPTVGMGTKTSGQKVVVFFRGHFKVYSGVHHQLGNSADLPSWAV